VFCQPILSLITYHLRTILQGTVVSVSGSSALWLDGSYSKPSDGTGSRRQQRPTVVLLFSKERHPSGEGTEESQ
jgi:hypothetical protein